jgi:tripartite-type tricarboxylate transporter receptor subunit TctC
VDRNRSNTWGAAWRERYWRLHSEIAKALKMPDVQAKLGDQLGMEVVGGTPEELAALMAREIPRWGALVKKSGATAN